MWLYRMFAFKLLIMRWFFFHKQPTCKSESRFSLCAFVNIGNTSYAICSFKRSITIHPSVHPICFNTSVAHGTISSSEAYHCKTKRFCVVNRKWNVSILLIKYCVVEKISFVLLELFRLIICRATSPTMFFFSFMNSLNYFSVLWEGRLVLLNFPHH